MNESVAAGTSRPRGIVMQTSARGERSFESIGAGATTPGDIEDRVSGDSEGIRRFQDDGTPRASATSACPIAASESFSASTFPAVSHQLSGGFHEDGSQAPDPSSSSATTSRSASRIARRVRNGPRDSELCDAQRIVAARVVVMTPRAVEVTVESTSARPTALASEELGKLSSRTKEVIVVSPIDKRTISRLTGPQDVEPRSVFRCANEIAAMTIGENVAPASFARSRSLLMK